MLPLQNGAHSRNNSQDCSASIQNKCFMKKDKFIIVRGAGDIASGIIWYLNKAGYNVLSLDLKEPSSIRREVSFSEAIYDGEKSIEGVKAVFVKDIKDLEDVFLDNNVAVMIDEKAELINVLKPDVVVDAILAKKNLGTTMDMAPLVIGVGPGFTARLDCHYVIETMRGHTLAKIYEYGSAIPNTGIPGLVAGHDVDRVMHSPSEGYFINKKNIGDIVKKEEEIATIKECIDRKETGNEISLHASIDGVLRGLIRNNFYVKKGLKVADIDPRESEKENSFTISDKARSIAGAVLLCIIK